VASIKINNLESYPQVIFFSSAFRQ